MSPLPTKLLMSWEDHFVRNDGSHSTRVFCQQMAWPALLTSYGHGSPDNAFVCGNSTGYDDGRSGTRVATATSLAMAMAALTALVAMATALAMAMVASATRSASVAIDGISSRNLNIHNSCRCRVPSPDLSQLFDGTRRCRGLNFAPCSQSIILPSPQTQPSSGVCPALNPPSLHSRASSSIQQSSPCPLLAV